MRLLPAICCALLLEAAALSAQPSFLYGVLSTEANRLYQTGHYSRAASKYAEAFVGHSRRGTFVDTYRAVMAWTQAGHPDSAFLLLDRFIRTFPYENTKNIRDDQVLRALQSDSRWAVVLRQLEESEQRSARLFDAGLAAMLDTIYKRDQGPRNLLADIEREYGYNSPEMIRYFRKVIATSDSLNQIEVTRLLDEKGWIGKETAGERGSTALFLVIQHAGPQMQEKYLPMMREAVLEGKAETWNLALLEDRVLMGRGLKQLYGSQVRHNNEKNSYYVYPLENPDLVDRRRAMMGLGPLKEYVKAWNIEWNVRAYKKELPALEKIMK